MGSVITFRHIGDFKNTERFLKRASNIRFEDILRRFGEEGVNALASATPIETGLTSSSWTYKITDTGDTVRIGWDNTNENKGVNIAVILQYGHGTRNGGWVEGRDYINPAIAPIFDKIADEAWKEVTKG